MIRGAWVWRNGQLVEKGGPKDVVTPVQRSGLPCPMIVSDIMEPVEHPCDGQYYSSKSTFRRVTKANGCIEVGNDPARKRPVKRKLDDAGIDNAIEKAIARAS